MTTERPTIHDLREPVETPGDGIVSRTIHVDDEIRVVLFSFAAGQQLSDHTAAVPATLEIVEGEAEIAIGDEQVEGHQGTWVHLPAGMPHGIVARTPVTMLLMLLKHGG